MYSHFPISRSTPSTLGIREGWGNFAEGCHKSATPIGFLDKEGGIQVLNMYVHLFRSDKHTSHFELVKFGLQLVKGASVVL